MLAWIMFENLRNPVLKVFSLLKLAPVKKCGGPGLHLAFLLSIMSSGALLAETEQEGVARAAEKRSLVEQLDISLKLYKTPGVQIFYYHSGKPGKTVVRGYRDAALKTKVAPDDIFRAGDLARPLSSLLALRLNPAPAEKKAAGALDTSGVLKEFPLKSEGKLSLLHLLNGTSGFESRRARAYPPEKNLTPAEFLRGHETFVHAPGKETRASDLPWAYLELLIEKWSGKTYRTALQDELLTPLGLELTSVGTPADQKQMVDPILKRGKFNFKTPDLTYPVLAARGLYTSAADYGKYLRYLEGELKQGGLARNLFRMSFPYAPELGGVAPGWGAIRLDEKAGAFPLRESEGEGAEAGLPVRPDQVMYKIESFGPGFAAIAVLIPGQGGAVLLCNLDDIYFLRETLIFLLVREFPGVLPKAFYFNVKKPAEYPRKRGGGQERDLAAYAPYEELKGFYRPLRVSGGAENAFNFLNDTRVHITHKNGLEFSGLFQSDAAVEFYPLGKDIFLARGNAAMNGWRVKVKRTKTGVSLVYRQIGCIINECIRFFRPLESSSGWVYCLRRPFYSCWFTLFAGNNRGK